MKPPVSLAAGVLSALAATAGCSGPLALVTLGLGGAWAARLQGLAPLQPVFAGLTLAFTGYAFHRLYVAPRRCAPGEACEVPAVLRRQRAVFWFVVSRIPATIRCS